jgi:hypothetical protein
MSPLHEGMSDSVGVGSLGFSFDPDWQVWNVDCATIAQNSCPEHIRQINPP